MEYKADQLGEPEESCADTGWALQQDAPMGWGGPRYPPQHTWPRRPARSWSMHITGASIAICMTWKPKHPFGRISQKAQEEFHREGEGWGRGEGDGLGHVKVVKQTYL